MVLGLPIPPSGQVPARPGTSDIKIRFDSQI